MQFGVFHFRRRVGQSLLRLRTRDSHLPKCGIPPDQRIRCVVALRSIILQWREYSFFNLVIDSLLDNCSIITPIITHTLFALPPSVRISIPMTRTIERDGPQFIGNIWSLTESDFLKDNESLGEISPLQIFR